MSEKRTGKVYLVGGGPGDPKLITLKGVECLERADVVIYDLLISDALLEHCPPHCERIYGGKRPGEQRKRQDEINALMLRKAKDGKTVVRLKGGDPFIFGRGGEEVLTLVEAGSTLRLYPALPPQSRHRHMQVFRSPIETMHRLSHLLLDIRHRSHPIHRSDGSDWQRLSIHSWSTWVLGTSTKLLPN